MSKEEIKRIPKDRTVTYARIVVDYRPQKEDPNRVQITVSGNLIDYPGELTTGQQISQQQNFCGTAHSAHQEHDSQQQTWEIFISQLH